MGYLLSHDVSQSDSIGSPGVNMTTGQASSYLSYASSVLKHDGKNGRQASKDCSYKREVFGG